MAKAFISLFSVPSRRSKGEDSSTSENNAVSSYNDPNQEPEPDNSVEEVDPDKLEHDEGVVKGIGAQALEVMAASGICLSSNELACARRIMTNVAGLARRVNDSAALMDEFERLVDSDPSLKGDSKVLARRIATRWNTDHTALKSHLNFKTQVQLLTNNASLKLRKHALNSEQWDLARELCQVLAIFEETTNLFSKKEVPLIHEVIPIMLTLRSRLYDVRDDILNQGLHPITRVAAQAALFVWDKYMGATLEQSDIYLIAVDRKLKWFAERSEFDVDRIHRRVVERFISRDPSQPESSLSHQPLDNGNIWTQRHTSSAASPPQLERDSMTEYLSTSVENSAFIAQSGGVLGYWSSRLAQRPRVARFALDFLTAPASSVDAERAFSCGRLMVNHLQHQMSTRSFQAQMAVGSWYGTSLLPSLDDVAKKLEKHM
ncbi:hAT family dimerization protein [Ceratobasidium sp. AG-Ba]|nr:hAT family dimerization protein [Ceratobasidium sp. AG-Ba]QRW11059.1 hAT family dimerization protein [Ceratobasidium sp. AG-Ba]